MNTLKRINSLTLSLNNIENIYSELLWDHEPMQVETSFLTTLVSLENYMRRLDDEIQTLKYGAVSV